MKKPFLTCITFGVRLTTLLILLCPIALASSPIEIYQKYKNKHFREDKNGFNDDVVLFKLNPETKKPNIVRIHRYRGKISDYEYTYDQEAWFDYSVNKTKQGTLIRSKDLNKVFRWSYPWEKDLFAHPEWEAKRESLREKVKEEPLEDGSFGAVKLKGETLVVLQPPHIASYLLSEDSNPVLQSKNTRYPTELHLVEEAWNE